MKMRLSTYKLMLLALLFCFGCSISTKDAPQTSDLKLKAIAKFKEAVNSTNQRANWQAIYQSGQAISLYKELGADQSFNKYLLYRNRAKLLNRERLYRLAVSNIDSAVLQLKVYDKQSKKPNKYNYQLELLSSLKYKADYLRRGFQFQQSSNILFDLLAQKEMKPGIHAILKNLIGLNYYALSQYSDSYTHFNDLLKISNLDPKMRAHYLHNRANAGYRIGKNIQAFSDLSEAIGINQSLKRNYYVYVMRKDLGDLYLREGKPAMAIASFDLALNTFSKIDTEPDLFEIYNLKWSAALVLGHSGAYLYKDKYDSLTALYSAKYEIYDHAQEVFLLKAKSEEFYINQQPSGYLPQLLYTIAVALVVFAGLFLLFRIMVTKKKARIVSV